MNVKFWVAVACYGFSRLLLTDECDFSWPVKKVFLSQEFLQRRSASGKNGDSLVLLCRKGNVVLQSKIPLDIHYLLTLNTLVVAVNIQIRINEKQA